MAKKSNAQVRRGTATNRGLKKSKAKKKALPTKHPRRSRCNAIPGNAKVKYDSARDAEEAIRFRGALHASRSKKLPKRAYRCTSCHSWHVTAMSVKQYEATQKGIDNG